LERHLLKLEKTISPHLGEKILYAGSAIEKAESAMILVHGRGATADSMLPLLDELNSDHMMFVIPQADNFTWYPYRFIEERQANEPGISSGLILIKSIIKSLNGQGFSNEQIYLLGFSQGGCLAADYVARFPAKFAGVFVLSGGLIGNKLNRNDYSGSLLQTPVLFGCSTEDFHIPEERVHESARVFEGLHARVTTHIYENLGHTINQDELDRINSIIVKNNSLT
jgi:phospholipase/carboxylesterase